MTKRRPSRKANRSNTKFRLALLQLKRLKPHHQCEAMKMANNGFIRQMCTHVKKLRRAKLNGKQIKSLKRHRNKLRTLANANVSLTRKRKLLSQRGGFLPFLIPLLGSIVGPAIKGIANVITGQ